MTTLFEPKNWEFDVYNESEKVKKTTPGIILIAKEFPDNHNSKFPFDVNSIYLTRNPENFLKRQPVFYKQDDEVYLVLKNHCTNEAIGLINIVKEMKFFLRCSVAYNEGEAI